MITQTAHLFKTTAKLWAIAGCVLCWLFSGPLQADVKVAFIGDQGTDSDAQSVLQLIADEEIDLLLIQGDLGYDRQTALIWEENLNQALGVNFPVLTVVGNHENYEWPIYQQLITDRIDRIDTLECTGDYGVKAVCTFQNLRVVQVAAGVTEVPGVLAEDNYADYIVQELAGSDSAWRICSWHKNQQRMQIGGKRDETGWAVYEACLNVGGIVATGHEHSYSRTHLMDNFETQSVVHQSNHLEIDYGQTFAFVSGLGGRGIRDQEIDGDWWAAKYSSDQQANHGALFCTFAEVEATCYFKDITGAVPDVFTLESRVGPEQAVAELESGAPEKVQDIPEEPEPANPDSATPESEITDVPANQEGVITTTKNRVGSASVLLSLLTSLFIAYRIGRSKFN